MIKLKEQLNSSYDFLYNYHIFLDMDGVLTDFAGFYWKLFNIDFDKEIEKNNTETNKFVFGKIIKYGIKFWSEMPWHPDGKQLYQLMKKYQPQILTAPMKAGDGSKRIASIDCINGKKLWVQKNIGTDIKINIAWANEKYKYCKGKNYILIDDNKDNINDWNNAGGFGILHISLKDTLEKLSTLK